MDSNQFTGYSLAQTEIINALNREIWDPRTRRKCADKAAKSLNQAFGIDPAKLPTDGQSALEELRERGITFPSTSFSDEELAALRTHFLERRPPLKPEAPDRYFHPVRDIIAAPRLLELALSDQILAPVAQYFGTMPFLTGLRVWWMEYGAPLDGDQAPHRDHVDIFFCKLFLYLSDVTTEDAPHKFYAGSHNYARVKKRLVDSGVPLAQLPSALEYVFRSNFDTLKSDITDLFKDDLVTVTGKAGTTFLADTMAIHRGSIPAPGHRRLVFGAIYGLNLDPVSYEPMEELRTLPGWRERVGPSALAKHAVRPWL